MGANVLPTNIIPFKNMPVLIGMFRASTLSFDISAYLIQLSLNLIERLRTLSFH